MSIHSQIDASPSHLEIAEEAVVLVRRWLAQAAAEPADKSATQLAGVLKDPRGLPFAVGFIDGVIRPEDPQVAARNFADLAKDVPEFLPWHLRTAVRVGARVGLVTPRLVIPVVRRALRAMVGHLIVDATDKRLGRAIAKIRRRGARLNMNLLGEAVLGNREAARRLAGTVKLLERDDVDYVSIKVSSTVAPHSEWAFDQAVEHVVHNLTPLFDRALASDNHKFINLDMEEYRDLDLTIAVFTEILDQPRFLSLEAGIVLQAYLPDALNAMMRLQDWSAARRARGGAGIKVRVVKGANLPMERVEASLNDWPLATWSSKLETDANYKRVISYALEPEHVENVRIGVAGHNLFDLAFAWLLAGHRGVRSGMEIEMLLGMAQGQAAVVQREVGGLLLYTPVVHPAEFDVAIAYLIRRLEEGASHDNFISAVFDLHDDPELFERERERFLASIAALDNSVPRRTRTQNRLAPPVGEVATEFRNAPDTDSALPANRRWASEILARVDGSTLGLDGVAAHTITSQNTLDEIIESAVRQGKEWGKTSGSHRAAILYRAADALEQRRGEFAEVMAAETGKTLDQSDPEISEAIDFARYYAARASELDKIDGAIFVPAHLTVVAPPWNFPVAIPAGSTLAALAAGSAVVIKPAPQAARSGTVMVETLWEAGVPRNLLHLVHIDEGELGRNLIADPRVDRLILTGAFETAELFKSFRPELPLLAETSGKNAIIVTPSADLDLAVKDVTYSAFGHAGQKCSAASLVILVGSVGTSRRFRDQLVDAVTSLKVGYANDPATRMGPIIEPAQGKLLDALTAVAPGESWMVEPQRLDESGCLWSPGVRVGVKRGSAMHLTEFFGPVLGIMTAETLEEAIEIQNEVDYGLTAGLHTLDPHELALWLDRIEAGNLYVNRGTTGAIVQRQPFGGWKKSAVGAGFKAGGPNYLVGLGSWRSAKHGPDNELPDPVVRPLLRAAEATCTKEDVAYLERAFISDARAWREEFALNRDVSGISVERNVFRYRPVAVQIRWDEDAPLHELLRVLGAATLAGSTIALSHAQELPAAVRAAFNGSAQQQSPSEWIEELSASGPLRVRLIGGHLGDIQRHIGGRPDIAFHANPVTESGRIELLPFLREQSVTITAHRFGTPDHLSEGLL